MRLEDVMIPTQVARPGTSFEHALRACVERNVPGIPFVDARGRIVGRFSLRHAFRMACISHSGLQGGRLLGDDLDFFRNSPRLVAEVMGEAVEEYILQDSLLMKRDDPIGEALQKMEDYNTSYLFLLEDGRYLGVITRVGLAKLVLKAGC
jgi:CBS domain-containing protein